MFQRFHTRLLPVIVVGAALFTTSAALQKRVQKKGPADFPTTLRAAGEAWESGAYGACVRELKAALGLATERRAQELREAMPPAPEGWQVEPDRSANANQNPFGAMLAVGIGNIVERKYRQKSGRGNVSCTLTADSPLVQMFNMWLANPAMLDANSELIEYGVHKAVLKKQGSGFNLQILINGAHTCEVNAQGGVSEEQLFAMFDQRVVDRLAKVLGT